MLCSSRDVAHLIRQVKIWGPDTLPEQFDWYQFKPPLFFIREHLEPWHSFRLAVPLKTCEICYKSLCTVPLQQCKGDNHTYERTCTATVYTAERLKLKTLAQIGVLPILAGREGRGGMMCTMTEAEKDILYWLLYKGGNLSCWHIAVVLVHKQQSPLKKTRLALALGYPCRLSLRELQQFYWE